MKLLSRYRLFSALLLALTLLATPASAYDLLGRNETNLYSRDFQFNFGVGLGGLANDEGVSEDGYDLGWRFGMGYSLTNRLNLELYYQLSSIPLKSPDPLGGGILASKLFFNSEVLRLNYRFDRGPFDAWSFFPFLSVGIGLYQMTAVNSQSGLDFPRGFHLPLAAGFETYLSEDRLSLVVEYDYNLMFDEEQNPGTLALLGLSEASFDIHGLMLQLCWHLF